MLSAFFNPVRHPLGDHDCGGVGVGSNHVRHHRGVHHPQQLLSAFGEDNILWGTDSIWYGSPQPLIDAFRAFQIPEEYSQRYGYPQLTPRAKEKILGLNAARIYNMDPEQVRTSVRQDDLAWVKAAVEEYTAKGTPSKG